MRRSDIIILICATMFLAAALWIAQIQPRIDAATAPGAAATAWRGSLALIDVGLDVTPATATRRGAIQVWVYPHFADDVWFLPALPGHRPAPLDVADWLDAM